MRAATAASLLKHGQVKRIVLARPAVEAGERLGFLPGDLQAKVNLSWPLPQRELVRPLTSLAARR